MNVGNWIKRANRPGKYHLVESVVAGDAVTKCGRRMKDPGLEVRDEMPLTRMIGQPQLCKAGCDRPGMVVFNNEFCGDTSSHLAHGSCPGFGVVTAPEDDGSTHGETVP